MISSTMPLARFRYLVAVPECEKAGYRDIARINPPPFG